MPVAIQLAKDKRYLDALAIVSRKKNTTIGKLIVDALEKEHGLDIKAALSFFESDVPQNGQSIQLRDARHKVKAAQS